MYTIEAKYAYSSINLYVVLYKQIVNGIILSNNILQQAHYTHFLGITIDDKLKCANHISYI